MVVSTNLDHPLWPGLSKYDNLLTKMAMMRMEEERIARGFQVSNGGFGDAILVDLTSERGLTEELRTTTTHGVEVICGLVETAKLEENRMQRKRKHNKVGNAVERPVDRRWCAFVVLPMTMEPSFTMARMAELYDSALEACMPLRPPERVYLCLVDGGIISYYQLAMALGV